MNILIGLIVCCIFGGPLLLLLAYEMSKPKHDPNHTGITVGGRDIICPKCGSPNCQYDYEKIQHTVSKTTYRVRPLHLFKPVKSTTTEVPTFQTTDKKYRCMNCGWIFK